MYDNLNKILLLDLVKEYGVPLFVYSRAELNRRAKILNELELPFGHVVRYAVKANAHPEIVELFNKTGLHFDASSSYEAQNLLDDGVAGNKISLSSQQPAHNLAELLANDVQFVATSLHQLELFLGLAKPGDYVGVRVNPGMGAGHNNRTTTGGANSSFGLWNEYVPQALELAGKSGVKIDRLHVHIGSGADPQMWRSAAETALDIAKIMPDVTVLDIGGGYKIHRYGDEQEADMNDIAAAFSQALNKFKETTGRAVKLEIEPGTWLVGRAGTLLSSIVDIVYTGKDGHEFIRLDTGMNDIIRPSMYGAQHKITVLNDSKEKQQYVVVGHNCETGDILTPAPSDPEDLESRLLNKAAIGDIVAIHDAGAYCASFSAHGYNAFPSAKEIVVEQDVA